MKMVLYDGIGPQYDEVLGSGNAHRFGLLSEPMWWVNLIDMVGVPSSVFEWQITIN